MKKSISILTIALLMLSLTACGSSSSSSKEAAYDAGAANRMADTVAEPAAAMEYEDAMDFDYAESYEAEGAAGEAISDAPEELGEAEGAGQKKSSRKLITTVNISAESDDVETLAKRITDKVEFLGGYIESSNVYSDNNRYGSKSKSADIRARVPADKLDTFLQDVDGNSNITSHSTNTEDVTLSYADTEAHERALVLEQQSLERMMEKAENMEDIMAIQSQLTDVRYRLDSIRSQLRTYDNDITYSTVYLSLTETEEFTVTEEETVWDRIKNGFVDNLLDVMDAVSEFLIWFITHIPAIVLFAVIIIVLIFAIKRISTAGRRKKTVPVKRVQPAAPVNKGAVPAAQPGTPADQDKNDQGGQPEKPAEDKTKNEGSQEKNEK